MSRAPRSPASTRKRKPAPGLDAGTVKNLRDLVSAGLPEITPRHRDVLRAALDLFGERGFGGASLRELARRVDVSQPSLYHYFESKEQLLDQVIQFCGAELLTVDLPPSFPAGLEDVPRFIADHVFRIYEAPGYATFLRLLFALSKERPEVREVVRHIYGDSMVAASTALMRPFVEKGEITADEGVDLIRMLSNAVGLALIETRVLYGEREDSPALLRYRDFVVSFATEALRARVRAARRARPAQ